MTIIITSIFLTTHTPTHGVCALRDIEAMNSTYSAKFNINNRPKQITKSQPQLRYNRAEREFNYSTEVDRHNKIL